MAAVVGPVGIQHPDLRHGRIPLLLLPEIPLDMQEILEGHCQAQGIIQTLKVFLPHGTKTIQHSHIPRLFILRDQRLRLYQACQSGIHRVDAVSLDLFKFFLCDIPQNQICHGSADHRLFLLIQESDTLDGRICPLVELPWQEFHGECPCPFRQGQFLPV